MIRRVFRFKLTPTAEQESKFQQFVGVTRLVYNLAFEQRRDWWRQYLANTGGQLNYVSQSRQVTQLRAGTPWIAEVPSSCLTQALRDLDKAYANFFSGRSGYPTPRKRGLNDSCRFQAKDIAVRKTNRRWGAVWIPKIGWIKFRQSREIHGSLVNATVLCDALGWFISFVCSQPTQAPANDNPAIGIDRGIASTLALSDGTSMSIPLAGCVEKRLRRARRILARRKRGSARRYKQLLRVRKLCARRKRVRYDWLHRTSTHVARRYGTVVLEDLKIANMTASGRGKRGLNRSILEQGWGIFATMLAYKLEERGGTLIKVNPAYTSQTCSDCGVIDSGSRKSQASFVCTSCGFALNADHNAAINILRRSTSDLPVEGCGYAPIEAGTSRIAA